jgi:hypothetical protein
MNLTRSKNRLPKTWNKQVWNDAEASEKELLEQVPWDTGAQDQCYLQN